MTHRSGYGLGGFPLFGLLRDHPAQLVEGGLKGGDQFVPAHRGHACALLVAHQADEARAAPCVHAIATLEDLGLAVHALAAEDDECVVHYVEEGHDQALGQRAISSPYLATGSSEMRLAPICASSVRTASMPSRSL